MLAVKKSYNLEIKVDYSDAHIKIQLHGVVSDDGKRMYLFGVWNELDCYVWQSKEDLRCLANERDPWLEPPCPYRIQPENQGKFVWLTGSPGSGKSTVAHLMSKEAGYVYYEGDCAEYFLNPFIPPNVKGNPTKHAFRQKPLKVC